MQYNQNLFKIPKRLKQSSSGQPLNGEYLILCKVQAAVRACMEAGGEP
jgi:hypothetical protein